MAILTTLQHSSHSSPVIVLTLDEALTVLATLQNQPTHSNRDVRRVLIKYIEQLAADPPIPAA